MNYISEINSFYDWLETNQISSSAITLWNALMNIANKASWQSRFTVAISVLELKTGLKRRTLERARNELQQKGRIAWKKRAGNLSAEYTMISLYDKRTPTFDAQCVAQVDVQCVAQVDDINKLNYTKLNYNNNNSKIKILNFGELEEVLLSSDLWIENIQRANVRSLNGKNTYLTTDEVKIYLNQFLLQLQAADDCNRTEADAKKYFSNWLRIELRKEEQNGKDRQFKPSKGSYTKPRVAKAGIETISF